MEGLDDLLKLLTRVKKMGWGDALPNDLFGNPSQQAKCHPTYAGHLPTFLQAIEEARTCLKALNEAQRRLGTRLRCLRKLSRHLVLEDGINRLPNEILAIVFEMTRHFSGNSQNQFPVCVSHVSRRFRRVALATPSLWTTIHDSYRENQIREFISRSGQLDLEIKMHSDSGIEFFLIVVKDTSHRWSSFDIIDDDTEDLMVQLGITDLPRLRHLTYTYPVELSSFSIPRLSHIEGWGWVLPAETWFLSKLTHVQFHLSEEDEVIEDLAATLHCMENLPDLSFKLRHCRVENSSPSNNTAYPKPRSVRIDRLAITIVGEMHDSPLLFDALMHLRPSTVELSINSLSPERFLVNSAGTFFPYGSAIKLQISQTIDVMETLVELLTNCGIVKTVHFDAPMGKGPLVWRWPRLDKDEWERIRSLDRLRFVNCDLFTESEVETLTNNLLPNGAEKGLQSLEIISC
ncbi:hypothetical protein BD410DRAFT_308135 [Rickenella mellea]|uniref:Uncharacterized protein n=1 Tax=Rickenella mellea TaxID=50990 RepID=A0A4Y7Q0N9_9AGAM|nr:hypothetical protein BD410DRAFT_308135 [Rickenella mellea]